MKTHEIECSGEVHEVGIDDRGRLHLFHHDIEEEEALHDMGVETSECFKFLLLAERSPDELLMDSIADWNPAHIEAAVKLGADVNTNRDHALRVAAMMGDEELVGFLLDHGAGKRAFEREIAMRDAVNKNHLGVVSLLLGEGVNPNSVGGQHIVNASWLGHTDMVRLLLDAGADPDVGEGSAARGALSRGYTEIVKLLRAASRIYTYEDL